MICLSNHPILKVSLFPKSNQFRQQNLRIALNDENVNQSFQQDNG